MACFLSSATYCIVIFALMLLSLLETILVTNLMDQDFASQEKLKDDCKDKQNKGKTDSCNKGEPQITECSMKRNVFGNFLATDFLFAFCRALHLHA